MNPFIALPLIILLLYRAWSRQSLTPFGLVVAGLTAFIHALHPSPLPFTLLGTFFLAGTTATKVHHAKKATLTLSSSGSSGNEGPRTHVQVLANSGIASLLVLVHVFRHGYQTSGHVCIGFGNDELLYGIVANYAAVAADTFSSELGILAHSQPRLITTLQTVPRGTNGGVTLEGLAAGVLGSAIIAAASVALGTFCPALSQGWLQRIVPWSIQDKLTFFLLTTLWGALGSVLDSLLGALLQASVIDRRTGKVVEGSGGAKVLTSARRPSADSGLQRRKGGSSAKIDTTDIQGHVESRVINSGRDILDNNQINLLMAGIMSVGGMVGASWAWRLLKFGIFDRK